MTAELAPAAASQPARVAPSGARCPMRRLDPMRWSEWQRRVNLGELPAEAWRAVALDPSIGLAEYLSGKRAATPGRLARSFDRFYARLSKFSPHVLRGTMDAQVSAFAPKAFERVCALVAGDFGTGKVVVKGRGEDAEEEVVIDAAAAGVQLQAAKFALQCAGVGVAPKAGTSPTVNVTGSAQINLGDVLRAPLPPG